MPLEERFAVGDIFGGDASNDLEPFLFLEHEDGAFSDGVFADDVGGADLDAVRRGGLFPFADGDEIWEAVLETFTEERAHLRGHVLLAGLFVAEIRV